MNLYKIFIFQIALLISCSNGNSMSSVQSNDKQLLKIGTYIGCEKLPPDSPSKGEKAHYKVLKFLRYPAPKKFNYSGNKCNITVKSGNKISGDFLNHKNLTIRKNSQYDTHFAEISNDRVLAIWYENEIPIEVTIYPYDTKQVSQRGFSYKEKGKQRSEPIRSCNFSSASSRLCN